MTENHELDNIIEQLTKVDLDLELATKNRQMFYRLWIEWDQKEYSLKSKQGRLRHMLREKNEKTPTIM